MTTILQNVWPHFDALSLIVFISISEGQKAGTGGWVAKGLLGDDPKQEEMCHG